MFSMIGMIVIIGGLFYLECIIYPPEKLVITPSKMALWTGFILLCGSTLIHGFHPLLLVKSYGK